MSRVLPWQKISDKHIVEGTTSARSVMQQVGLDWKVTLSDVLVDTDFGLIEVPDKFATVRNNKDGTRSALSVVGSRYNIFQNEEIFSSLDFLVDSGEARYASAGELDGGKIVWMVMELPDSVKIAGDEHAGYLLARTSHDGSTAFQIAPIISRLSCTNQMNAAFASAGKHGGLYSLKHTQNNSVNVEDIRKIIKVVYEDFTFYEDMAHEFMNQTMNNMEFVNFVRKVYPMPSKIEFSPDDVLSPAEKRTRAAIQRNRSNAWLVWEGDTQANLKYTKFGALHAVVEVADHYSRSYEKASSKILLSKDGKMKSRAIELLRS